MILIKIIEYNDQKIVNPAPQNQGGKFNALRHLIYLKIKYNKDPNFGKESPLDDKILNDFIVLISVEKFLSNSLLSENLISTSLPPLKNKTPISCCSV